MAKVNNIKQLKTGDYFYARIDEVECVGRVRKMKAHVILFQNAIEGETPARARFGFKYGWIVRDPFTGDSHWDDVSDFRVITATEFKKLSKSLIVSQILGYDVKREGDQFQFGCGAVKLTSTEIKLIAKVFQVLGKNKESVIHALSEILDQEHYSSLATLTPKDILNLLKIRK